MSGTKPCTACGAPILEDVVLCPRCHSVQGLRRDAPVSEPADPVPRSEPRPRADAGPARETACPHCGAVTSQALCFSCGHSTAAPAPSGLVLTLPDGTRVAVGPGQTLDLGRESRDPRVAAALAAYAGVSRDHATLSIAGDRVTVLDRSTNGTRVDGTSVDQSFTASLSRISVIQLGHYCVIHVTRQTEGDHEQS